MNSERLQQQIQFIIEIDKLKSVLRRSYLMSSERRENSAEHSWHLTVMALVLAEHANEPLDLLSVLKMLVVHDIVEIEADDTFLYDDAGQATKAERENAAARQIFGLLPADQALELSQIWQEFELRATPEAKFAAALDRLMPLLHNCYTAGKSWHEHNINSSQVLAHNQQITDGSQALWELAQQLINEAIEKQYLPEN